MPESLQIGPLLLDGIVLAYVLSGAAAYAVISFCLRKEAADAHRIKDIVLTAMIIVVIFWKFGLLLTQPALMIETPALLILMSGSWREVVIGLLIATGYVVFQLYRHKIAWRLAADMLALGLLAFMGMKHLLITEIGLPTSLPWGISPGDIVQQYHPVGIYRAIGLFTVLLWIGLRPLRAGSGMATAAALLGLGAVQLAASLLKAQESIWIFLSIEQWGAILLIVAGYIWSHRGILKQERSEVE